MNISRIRHLLVSPGLLAAVLLASPAGSLHAQRRLAKTIDALLEAPPYDRAFWGILVAELDGRELYARNPDRLFVPASTAKLVVAAAATALLPPAHRLVTSVYAGGPIAHGVLDGDLVVYGRGDPTFSSHCYGTDTLAAGTCDSLWTRIDALADAIVSRGVRHISGAIVGDGSYLDAELVHRNWERYDLNWWYAAPVSGLAFNDNSVDVTYRPGAAVGMPPVIAFSPDLGLFQFQNRARTVTAGEQRTIDFFREPGTMLVWSEGDLPLDRGERTEYFALPDPNLYFAAALRAALARRGVTVAGPTRGTSDSTHYAPLRHTEPIAESPSRPLAEIIFPILNSSQSLFAEMLLKSLGRERQGEGSWQAGLEVERAFLTDSVGVDPAATALADGSGLASSNLMTPRAFVQLLAYMYRHPHSAGFLRALPRSGAAGSLRRRFVGTMLEGRVVAKTGSVVHVNALCGYVERGKQPPLVFAVMVNNHTVRTGDIIAGIDSVVAAAGR